MLVHLGASKVTVLSIEHSYIGVKDFLPGWLKLQQRAQAKVDALKPH